MDGIIVDGKGNLLGNDGQEDGKVYVVNSNISKRAAKKTSSFVKENSGNADAFKSGFDYGNVTEIEGSADTRQAMVDVVSADDGTGGASPNNNREYGGSIMPDGSVVAGEPGPVTTPDKGAAFGDYQAGDKTRFHSHPSGEVQQTEIVLGDFGEQNTSQVVTKNYVQSPSKKDISNAGTQTRYVFGRGNGTVYMYNKTGITATLPTERFVNFKKK